MSDTFNILEGSPDQGSPIWLYEFQQGSIFYRYTSTDEDVTVDGGVVYAALPVSEDGFTHSGDTTTDTMVVSIPADTEISRLYEVAPPSVSVIFRLRKTHYGLAASRIMFQGSILQYTRADDLKGQLTIEPITAGFGRSGIHATWDLTCRHPLYGPRCKVDNQGYATQATITSLTGSSINANEFATEPDGWFSFGYIEWEIGPNTYERRGVIDHVGTNLAIIGHSYPLAVGTVVTAYAGCNRTSDNCINKFNNYGNFGGFPLMPGRSPFDNNPVF